MAGLDAGQPSQVPSLTAQELADLRDARRKVKGAFTELSLALTVIDKLLKKENTPTE